MSMNPESRKRAIAAMLGTDDFVEGSIAHILASEHLDRLLDAGFHVAEWRKVEDEGKRVLVSDGINVIAAKKPDDVHHDFISLWVGDDGQFIEPNAIMDLPDPSKDGEG